APCTAHMNYEEAARFPDIVPVGANDPRYDVREDASPQDIDDRGAILARRDRLAAAQRLSRCALALLRYEQRMKGLMQLPSDPLVHACGRELADQQRLELRQRQDDDAPVQTVDSSRIEDRLPLPRPGPRHPS